PAPFVASDPYVPVTVAAVELEAEKMVVLGQVADAGVEDLEVGAEMELVFSTLFEDDENEYVVWKWRKVAA
ncbi:MAG: benzoylsuccinyl-CoA thiolase, partial [Myxococcota bacterium]